GRADDLRRPLRGRPVGHAPRHRDAAHPLRLVSCASALRPRPARPSRHRGGVVMHRPRLLRDYRDAGAVNTLLAPWGFVDDETFLTKAGHLGVVYAVRGIDGEALPHAQRRALTHRFEAALRLLDEHCRVYEYLIKQTVPS